MNYLRIRPQKGFTLVETIVSTAVLVTAVIAMLLIIGNAIAGTAAARDQMIATLLANEAVEVIRQKRDSNIISTPIVSWDEGFTSAECLGASCRVDASTVLDPAQNAPVIRQCVAGCAANGFVIQKVSVGGKNFYGHADTWDASSIANLGITFIPTKFSRTVSVDVVGGGSEELLVTVTVLWKNSFGVGRQMIVKEYVFNATPL